jgi:hypothetical protein
VGLCKDYFILFTIRTPLARCRFRHDTWHEHSSCNNYHHKFPMSQTFLVILGLHFDIVCKRLRLRRGSNKWFRSWREKDRRFSRIMQGLFRKFWFFLSRTRRLYHTRCEGIYCGRTRKRNGMK